MGAKPRTATDDGHPDCEMPDCDGSEGDETHAVRDPSGELLEMCNGCLNAGWSGAVEVLD